MGKLVTIHDIIRENEFRPGENLAISILACYGKGETEDGSCWCLIDGMEEYAEGWIGKKYRKGIIYSVRNFESPDYYISKSLYEIVALQLEKGYKTKKVNEIITTMVYLICAYEDLLTESYKMFDLEKEALNFSEYYENKEISLEKFRSNNYEKTKKLLLALHRIIIYKMLNGLVRDEDYKLLIPLLCKSSDPEIIRKIIEDALDVSVLLNIDLDKVDKYGRKSIKERVNLENKILSMSKEEQEEFKIFRTYTFLTATYSYNRHIKDEEIFVDYEINFIFLKDDSIKISLPEALEGTCDFSKAVQYYVYKGIKEGTIELKPGIILPGININKSPSSLSK